MPATIFALRGRVEDASGKAVSGAEVIVLSADVTKRNATITSPRDQERLRSNIGIVRGPVPPIPLPSEVKAIRHRMQPQWRVTSNANGDFEIADLPSGSFTVIAVHSASRTESSAEITLNNEKSQAVVALRLAKPVVTSPKPAVAESPALRRPISGRVVDAYGAPVSGALVGFEASGGLRNVARTNRQGRFRIQRIANRQARLIARHPEYGESVPQSLSSNDPIELILSLRGAVYGRAIDKFDGTPLRELSIYTARSSRNFNDASGEYRLFLDDGAHTLTFSAPGYAAYTTQVRIAPESGTRAVELAVELVRAGTLRGVLRTTDGSPLAHAFVRCGSANTRSAADGSFALAGVAEGTRTVHIRTLNRRELTSDPITIRGGETTGPVTIYLSE
jgi:hypothetical protein